MLNKNTVVKKTATSTSQKMTMENLLIKHNMKLDDSIFVEEWPDGIFIRRKKVSIWDFVGKIKASGSVDDERESMIEAAITHAVGEDKKDPL